MPQKPCKEEIEIDAYASSTEGITFKAAKSSLDIPETCIEDERVFDMETYSQEVHSPVSLGLSNFNKILNKEYPRCLDMPLRLSGEDTYRLPEEWQELQPLIESIISLEHKANPNWRDYNTYLTIDCSEVEEGEQQRHGGLHVDRFQGERIDPKTKITRNYVLSTNGGTRFFPKRFVCIDPKKFNVFHGFDMQTQG